MKILSLVVWIWTISICFGYGNHGSAFTFPTFTNGHGIETHSFHSPFQQSENSPLRLWTLSGKALVSSDHKTEEDLVRLTNAQPSQRGLIYSIVPLLTYDFSVYFDFLINKPVREPGADGFTFFMLNEIPKDGPVYGLEESFQGLVIALDTFSNSRTRRVPYLYGMMSKGDLTWDANKDGSTAQLAEGCHVDLTREDRIFLELKNGELQVAVGSSESHRPSRHCFKVQNVKFPKEKEEVYFGFSAETGHHLEEHNIRKFEVHPLNAYPDIDTQELLFEIENEGITAYDAYVEMYDHGMDLAHEDYDYHDDYDAAHHHERDYDEHDHHEHDHHEHDRHEHDHHEHLAETKEREEDHYDDHSDGHHSHGTRAEHREHERAHPRHRGHLSEIEQTMEELKGDISKMLIDQAPDSGAFVDFVRDIKSELGVLLELMDDMELSFSDIEDGTEDVPAKANELLSRVHKLKDVMKMVEDDLLKVENSCKDVDSMLTDIQRLTISTTDDMSRAISGNSISFWIFAVLSQVLFGLLFVYIYQSEKQRGTGRHRGGIFGRLV